MWPWWLVYLLVPVFVGIIVTEYKSDIFRLLKSVYTRDAVNDSFELVIYVPSARGNFDQRKAIRETWLRYATDNLTSHNRVLVKFAVGADACNLPPEDRLNVYSCDEWHVGVPVGSDEENVFAVSDVAISSGPVLPRLYGVQSLAFTVHHPIVLTHLSILTQSIGTRASVKLLEAITQKEIVSSVFTTNSNKTGEENFVYRSVQPFYLPKGFEGVIVGENLATGSGVLSLDHVVDNRLTTVRNNASGVLQFHEEPVIPSGYYYDLRRWKSRVVDIVSFVYQVKELDVLRKHTEGRVSRVDQQQTEMKTEQQQLSAEIHEFNDIILLDVVDVYRNLPQKWLLFAKWVVENVKFAYLLKTDDDCFVDVQRIVNRLSQLGRVEHTWLGRFRHNWVVERHGKWLEPRYSAVTYPRFACGAGYVLSADLVRWIAVNSQSLATYQGEDVSLGIWLAAVAPNIIDEPLWQCEKDCLSDMYAEPQLHPDELRQLWSDWVKCRDPCGCD